MIRREIFRIIDANFNRSREGLRVCEEVARFIWNSPDLTRDLRAVRHSVSAVLKDIPATARILSRARDSEGDVARCAASKSGTRRIRSIDIFVANIQRVKESLRVLEEFFKLIDKKKSALFTDLRFKVYQIEKRALK